MEISISKLSIIVSVGAKFEYTVPFKIEWYRNSDYDYLMFMLHSSEMMPGGSPTFQTEGGIEILYEHLEIIFGEISNYFEGISLDDYAKELVNI